MLFLMGERANVFPTFKGETCWRKLFPTGSHLNFDALKNLPLFEAELSIGTLYFSNALVSLF
jgi:hypothetical protein